MTMRGRPLPWGDAPMAPADTPRMPAPTRSMSLADISMLLFLGAVWGGAFLFFRIAGPEVGPSWAAEIRVVIGAAILALIAGRRTFEIARRRPRQFLIVGATFSAIPFSFIA